MPGRSQVDAPLADREEAGRLLGESLQAFRGQKDVTVVGIARGGVLVAAEIARVLQAPLHVWVARKMKAPSHRGLAMGSLAEDGEMVVHEETLRALRVPAIYLVEEVRRLRREIARQASLFRHATSALDLAGRRVIVADDGMATGATMLAALRGLRRKRPASLIAAVPVASRAALRQIEGVAHGVRTLSQPAGFSSIEEAYGQFREVTDDDVLATLSSSGGGSDGFWPFEGVEPR